MSVREFDGMDLDESKANELMNAVNALNFPGVYATVHWDRSPWGIRIKLDDSDDEYGPALYVLTELIPINRSLGGFRWSGQLSGLEDEFPEEVDQYDIGFEFLERTFIGDTTASIAPQVAQLALMLRGGLEAMRRV